MVADTTCEVFTPLQGNLHTQMLPKQAICSNVYVITGIFHDATQVWSEAGLIGNAAHYAVPFVVITPSVSPVRQVRPKDMLFEPYMFGHGCIVVSEYLVAVFLLFLSLVTACVRVIRADGNTWPQFAFFLF